MTQDKKVIIKRFYDEVINERNLELLDELTTPDFIEHEEVAGVASGREGAKQFFSMVQSAFPDFRMNVEDIISEGDKVVVRSKLTGTHKGEFMGVPATGKSISVSVIDIVLFSEGKVAEHWGVTDTGGMMEQLGAS